MVAEGSKRIGVAARDNVIWPAPALKILRRTMLEDYAAERLIVNKGRNLLVEGGETTSVFFQLTGWTALECVSERGERVLIDFSIAGDFIGLPDDGPYASCTVTALTDLALLRIDRTQLNALIEDNQAFRNVYISALQAMLRRTQVRRLALSAKTGAAKVCGVLCDLADRVEIAGDHVGDSGRARLPISQVLLACAVGLTPVAVNRIVQNLRRAGVLDWGISGISVIDLKRLREFA
jgi:CRP-like cAMP-binding protein